jgi:hypothetical protein
LDGWGFTTCFEFSRENEFATKKSVAEGNYGQWLLILKNSLHGTVMMKTDHTVFSSYVPKRVSFIPGEIQLEDKLAESIKRYFSFSSFT